MTRLSQKGLLNEGIGSMLKKAAQAVGGAVGGVGGALKAVSDAGINATWTDAAKGGVAGAKKGWKAADLTSPDEKLKKYIENTTKIIIPTIDNIQLVEYKDKELDFAYGMQEYHTSFSRLYKQTMRRLCR